MPRLAVVAGKQMIAALEKDGFCIVDQEGSHVKMKKRGAARTLTVIVPVQDELAR